MKSGRLHAAYQTRGQMVFVAVLLAISALFALLSSEIFLRVIDFPFDEAWVPLETRMGRYDEELGWTYLGGGTFEREFRKEKRKVAMHFDEHGVRMASPQTRHDEEAETVFLIGCSVTFGHGLPYEETFAARLDAIPDYPQVVNLGVQGYGTDQAFLRLRRHLARFSNVRAVIYTFIPRHVFRNAYADRRLLFRHARFPGTKPLFAITKDQRLKIVKRPARYEDNGDYSRVLASIRVARARHGPRPDLTLTHAIVDEMRRTTEAGGAVFIVNEWNMWGQTKQWAPDGSSLFAGRGLNVVRSEINTQDDWREWFIPGDLHPNARAHAHVATLLAEELHRQGLGPRVP